MLLVESFKELTEWLGLSTAASDDAAEKVKSNNEKIKAGTKGGDPNEWSARKAQLLAVEYKKKGGGYK